MRRYRTSGDGHGPLLAVSATATGSDSAASGNRDRGRGGQKRREWGSPAWMWRGCSPWWVRGDRRGRGMRQGSVGKRKDGGGIGQARQAQGRARATLGSDLDQMMVFSPCVDGSAELDNAWGCRVRHDAGRLGYLGPGGGWCNGPGCWATRREGAGEAQVQRVSDDHDGERESGAGKGEWPRLAGCGR